MIVLGLTGSIGMGKSTTLMMFAEEGIAVYSADDAVHELYEGKATALIGKAFPGSVTGGKVDRTKLAAMVLHKPDALKRLEAIVHPLVRQKELAFVKGARKSGAALAVLDIPLLFETQGEKRVDKVVVVTADPQIQRDRVLSRPGMTNEKFTAILARQMPDADKRTRADYIIDTGTGLEATRNAVRAIIRSAKENRNHA
jgi:dephospho-CoA kinase